MRASISGLGIHRPDTIRLNDAWPEALVESFRSRGDRTLVDIPRSGDALDHITAGYLAADAHDPFIGAVSRRVSTGTAWEAEAAAGRDALLDANVDPADVDAVLSWSIVSDRASLPSATKVASAIGATRAWASGVDSGCASALVQLDIALGLVESGRARHVLLTQSHLITRAFPMAHPASPGVGDCATAMLVSASEHPGILGVHSASHGEHWDAVTWVRGRTQEEDTSWWLEGGAFTPGSRDREAARHLMQHSVRFGVDTVRTVCERMRVSPSDIGVLCSVQPRAWIGRAITAGLDLSVDAPDTYSTLAHVGGCGVVANLIEARERGLLAGGRLVALYAQGAGFTRSAALVRFLDRDTQPAADRVNRPLTRDRSTL